MNKILILSDLISPHTLRWVKALDEKGHQIAVVSFSGPGDLIYPETTKLKIISNPGRYNFFSFLKAIIWANIFRLAGFKTVNAMYAVNYGLIGACVLFCNLFVSVWGSDILVRPRRSRFARLILRFVFKQSKAIFATSKILMEATRVYTNKPIFEIPFGLNIDEYQKDAFENKKKYLDQKLVKIACVKSLKLIYGQDVLMRALANIKHRREGFRFKLFLTGDGPDESYYKMLAKKLGLNSDVEFTGRLTPEEALTLQKKVDMGVYPSLSESFGVSVLESICYGNITIASNVGGIPEIIKHKNNGLLFETKNSIDLADKIEQALNDKDLQQRLLFADVDNLKNKYDWHENKNVYLKIIENSSLFNLKLLKNQSIGFEEMNKGIDFIFHYPGPITRSISGRPIRLNLITEAFNKHGNTFYITGHVDTRYMLFQKLKFFLKVLKIKKPSWVYSETHTNATLLIHGYKKIIKSLKADYALFNWSKKNRIPLSVYIRDAHWKLPEYKYKIWKQSVLKRKIKEAFHHLDFFIWERFTDNIYIPNKKFIDYLPRSTHMKAIPLPPGTTFFNGLNILCNSLDFSSIKEMGSFMSENNVFEIDENESIQDQLDRADIIFFNVKNFPLTVKDMKNFIIIHESKKLFMVENKMSKILKCKNFCDNVTFLNKKKILELAINKLDKYDSTKLNLLYAGGMGEIYPIHNYISILAAKRNVHIYMCVRENELSNILDTSIYNSDKITLLFDYDRAEILNILRAMDFGLLAFDYTEYMSKASPIKAYDYMSAGIPILSDKSNGLSDEISIQDIGICLDLKELKELDSTALKKISFQKRQNVSNYAIKNTWNHRVQYLIDKFNKQQP